MKINGSLVFDASSASEIQNLRLQKFGTVPTAPEIGDNGRLIYVTGTGTIYVAVAGVWVPLATGGDASALLAEVDRIETALGLNADGSFDASLFTGNLAGKTTYVELITELQTLVADATAAAAAEKTRAEAAEAALGVRVDDEKTRAEAAELVLTNGLAAEVARATAAEGTLTTDLATEATTRGAADTALGVRVDDEATARAAADTALGLRIDGEATARASADTALGVRVDDEAAAREAADTALSGRITTEVSDRTTAVNAVASDLAQEILDRDAGDAANASAIGAETTRATAQEQAIRGEIASALAGMTWEAPVVANMVDHTTASGLTAGQRVVNTTDNTIYTWDGTAFDAGEALVDGAAFFNSADDTGYVFNGTAVVPFSGASSFVAGAGLAMTGNTVNIGNNDGSITVTADDIAISAAVRAEITNNATAVAAEAARAGIAEAGLDDRIDDEVTARTAAIAAEVLARDAAILVEKDRAEAAETALATNITAEETRALAAEAALGVRVDGAGTALTTAIATEVSDRNAAIAAEALLRSDADAAEVLARDAAIAAEATLRTAADDALTARISKMYFLYDDGAGAEAGTNTTHVVDHNLGQSYCNVTVISNNEVVIPQSITYNTPNRLTVTFNTSIPCRVVCMGLAAVITP